MTIPPDVRNAVVTAYYARAMASSDAARQRAQAGYGIASAIAAAVAAAGLFGGLDHRPTLVQASAVAALFSWLIAAGLFLHTVSSSFAVPLAEATGDERFVTSALESVRNERQSIDKWQRAAQVMSAFAALLSVGAFALALWVRPGTDVQAATITVTGSGLAALRALCADAPRTVTGTVADSELGEDFLAITLDPGICGEKRLLVALPRAHVRAATFHTLQSP